MTSSFATLPSARSHFSANRFRRLNFLTCEVVPFSAYAAIKAYPTKLMPILGKWRFISESESTSLRKSEDNILSEDTADADSLSPPFPKWQVDFEDESTMSRVTDHDIMDAEAGIFLDEVYSLLSIGKLDEATDVVYDHIHELLTVGDYEQSCAIFLAADPRRLGSYVSRSLLSLTVKRKKSLWSRAKFYRSAFDYIQSTQDEGRAKRLLGHLA